MAKELRGRIRLDEDGTLTCVDNLPVERHLAAAVARD
jgi:hypothetical protein